MKEILVLTHHHGVNYFDASTPELKAKAFVSAFNYLEEGEYYTDVENHSEIPDWKEEMDDLQEFVKTKKIPKILDMGMNEVRSRILELKSWIENANEDAELYKECKKGDAKAIELFMTRRMSEGAESEDFTFATVQ